MMARVKVRTAIREIQNIREIRGQKSREPASTPRNISLNLHLNLNLNFPAPNNA
jgi:hypothetical protein